MDCNYSQIVEMSHDDKVKMYKKLKKDELIEMLIEANNVIESLQTTPKVLPLKLNECAPITPPPVSSCKSWDDCNNPYRDCFNCPVKDKMLSNLTYTTTTSNIQRRFF